MYKFKSIVNNIWFIPSIVLIYGIFYILFGEWYVKTISTDGYVFYNLIESFDNCKYYNSYYINRIAPVLIMRTLYQLLSITISIDNVFIGFQVLNLISIIISCIFLKKLFVLFKISDKKQILGMFLFLVNFALLKYPFYLAVMTDTFAIMLSILLLYFYLKNETSIVILLTLVLAFTWPMGFYQGILLIAFPSRLQSLVTVSEQQKKIITGGSVLYALLTIIIYVYIQQQDITLRQVERLNRSVLPLSILVVLVAFGFISKIFYNKNLWNIKDFFEKLNYKRVGLAILTFVFVYITVYLLEPNPIPTYTTEQMLRDPFIHALIKPFYFIITDITYFGVGMLLLFFFWNSFAKVVSQLGWGIVAAIALNLFLFGTTPQTRHLSNLFPWIILFLMKAIDKYSFSRAFYITIGIGGILVSKIWLILNNFDAYPPMELDKNGCMGFPHQKFFMHIGPWMNEQMYYVQGGAFLIIGAILFIVLYRIEKSPAGKWLVLAKYK